MLIILHVLWYVNNFLHFLCKNVSALKIEVWWSFPKLGVWPSESSFGFWLITSTYPAISLQRCAWSLPIISSPALRCHTILDSHFLDDSHIALNQFLVLVEYLPRFIGSKHFAMAGRAAARPKIKASSHGRNLQVDIFYPQISELTGNFPVTIKSWSNLGQ